MFKNENTLLPDQIVSNNQRPPIDSTAIIPDPKTSIYHVPSFLVKLYEIVDSIMTDEIISWTDGGDGFQIKNQNLLCDYILP